MAFHIGRAWFCLPKSCLPLEIEILVPEGWLSWSAVGLLSMRAKVYKFKPQHLRKKEKSVVVLSAFCSLSAGEAKAEGFLGIPGQPG